MNNKDMETKDPALTKTPIIDTDVNTMPHHDNIDDVDEQKGTQTLQETVIGTRYANEDGDYEDHNHEEIHHNAHNVMSTNNDIEDHTTVNKGTDTFQETIVGQESIVGSEHVYEGDNAARQPDRRDQKGNPFDDGINEHNVVSEQPDSVGITNQNRYANIDNAQTRILNPDEKDQN